jgi:hypothetical protein
MWESMAQKKAAGLFTPSTTHANFNFPKFGLSNSPLAIKSGATNHLCV